MQLILSRASVQKKAVHAIFPYLWDILVEAHLRLSVFILLIFMFALETWMMDESKANLDSCGVMPNHHACHVELPRACQC